MKTTLFYTLMCVFVILLSSCAQYFHQPLRISEARLGAETPQFRQFDALPAPKDKIVAAVYKFRDQTGQYKNTQAGTSWSTAVTQGATSILLRAMEESGWFVPIEREGLSNLLNERKIIRSSMSNYTEEDHNKLLPPLVFAGIILEGGIISFDSNIMTGGAGARYFGAGASTKYREDRVTIYLRAVSTSNGRILKTIYTSKTILSQQIDVGVFRFVSTRRLLEAETGFTYNEPGEMAVKEAIEKAVYALVIEGIVENLWQVKSKQEMENESIRQYMAEKDINSEIDAFGNRVAPRRATFGLGIRGGGLLYQGDYRGSQVFPGGEINVELFAHRPISLDINTGIGRMGIGDEFNATISYATLGVKYRFFNLLRTTPYVRVGAGVVTEVENSLDGRPSLTKNTYPEVTSSLGLEFLLKKNLGISGAVNYHLYLSDNIDRLDQGKYNDFLWAADVGITYYLK
ncbi:Curli production assembly/transport component CsgG [Fulvivirga imtechensis AK7]|uniref:Curli production assembly/transport component CsgG n=1 Tax=Fulvivirga imtechensis AK7 TaxID=1237149 RepID=L8JSG8_9BACT|nr:CsgG/HfaB family protein [Fulvivirga imtechensis]ELR71921.1 Curli production assembly/transport component CsgG [Fulvivirga imtechensis AK7]